MKIAIRVDSSSRIGSGHVARCLTLARSLESIGAEILFITRDHDRNSVSMIEGSGFTIVLLAAPNVSASEANSCSLETRYASWLGASWGDDADDTIDAIGGVVDWLIVDHYAIDECWHRKLRRFSKNIFVIDDLANRRFDCDVLLDQTVLRNLGDYSSFLPKSCKTLLGTKFAILRDEFIAARSQAISRRQSRRSPRSILVCMGGTDPDNITEWVLAALRRVSQEKMLEIDVVLSSQAPYIERIRELIVKNKSFYNTKLHIDCDYMAQLMVRADLAVGAGGTTSWERCCLGLPTIVIPTADNQMAIVKGLVDTEAAVAVDFSDSVGVVHRFQQMMKEFLDNTELLRYMSDKAFEICDGEGVRRCLPFFEENKQ